MSPVKAARVAGFGYLVVFVLGSLGNLLAFEKLLVRGDAARSATNIIAQPSLFRAGIASWLVVVVADAIVAWSLYVFFEHVDQQLSRLAAWFRLVFVAIFAYSFVSYGSVIETLSGASYLAAFDSRQLQALAMQALHAHDLGMHVSFVFFGLHVATVGYLMLRSGHMPQVIAVLLLLAGVGYQVDSFGNVLSASYASSKLGFAIFVALPAVLSEASLMFWLLFKAPANYKRFLRGTP
jgi:hypothetical protein